MANVLTKNIWECSSLGIISTGPVLVKGIMYYPAAVDGEFTLKWWDEAQPPTLYARAITYTNTVSTDNTVTATTSAFPSTWIDGNVVKCLKTTGSDTGKYGLIQTAGNNTRFVTWGAPFTTEAAVVGDWDCYPTYTAFRGKASKAADTETSMWFPFGGEGFWFPNLALDDFDTSDVVIIYVG
jgi:hypothetical protein